MTKHLFITGILAILIISVIFACKCQKGDDPRIAQLQADTARQGKEIRRLRIDADSSYNRAIETEEANKKPKEERQQLKRQLPKDSLKSFLDALAKSGTIQDYIKKNGALIIGNLISRDKKADEIIANDSSEIKDLKTVKLFQDSTINHLEAKVKDVGEMNEIHLKEYLKEKTKNLWNKVLMIALPIVTFILGLMAK